MKHIQELVEVKILDDFNQKFNFKLSELTEEIADKILYGLLEDCTQSCESLFNN